MSGERDSRHRFLTPSTLPTTFVCRELSIPNSPEWLALVDGALVEMVNAWDWDEFGAVTPEEAAQAALIMFGKYLESGCALIGEIRLLAVATLPDNMLACDGATHLKADYPLLYAALASVFIVDATHFKTPDLRGYTAIGAGAMASGFHTFAVGDKYGNASQIQAGDQVAQHTHYMYHSHSFVPLVTGDLDVEGVGVPQPNAAQIIPFFTGETNNFDGYTSSNNPSAQPTIMYQPSLALLYAIRAK